MIYVLIALAVFLLDWNIKNYIERHFDTGKEKNILKGKITVKKQYNRGLSFSILKEKADYVRKISAFVFGILLFIFILLLPQKNKAIKKLGMSLCVGGAASNVADRVKRGYVVDYFILNIKPLRNIVFNLADIFIFIGCFITFLASPVHSGKSPVKCNENFSDAVED